MRSFHGSSQDNKTVVALHESSCVKEKGSTLIKKGGSIDTSFRFGYALMRLLNGFL